MHRNGSNAVIFLLLPKGRERDKAIVEILADFNLQVLNEFFDTSCSSLGY